MAPSPYLGVRGKGAWTPDRPHRTTYSLKEETHSTAFDGRGLTGLPLKVRSHRRIENFKTRVPSATVFNGKVSLDSYMF